MLAKEVMTNVFKGDIIGREIIFFESTSSTNDSAIKTGLEREDPEGIVVIADEQTRDRGRLGRIWKSPSGVNLYFMILLKPPLPPKNAPLLTLAAAVAVASAIRAYSGVNAEIKGPNDILVSARKTGGILMEMRSLKEKIILLAVGIGINVNIPLDTMKDMPSHSASLMNEKNACIYRTALFGALLAEMEKCYKILLKGN